MDKPEWDAMEREGKHLMILEKVFGYPTEMTDTYREDAKHGPGRGIFQPPRNYTTDRNACALVLDVIEKRGLRDRWMFEVYEWGEEVDAEEPDRYSSDANANRWAFVRLDPDMICYCAIKAVEDDS